MNLDDFDGDWGKMVSEIEIYSIMFADSIVAIKSEYELWRRKWQLQPSENCPLCTTLQGSDERALLRLARVAKSRRGAAQLDDRSVINDDDDDNDNRRASKPRVGWHNISSVSAARFKNCPKTKK